MDGPQESSPMQPERPSVGAPPPPDVNVRTMASDIQSLESGQTRPVPERVSGPILPPEPENEPIFRPETISQMTGGGQTHKNKKPVWIVLGVVIVIGLGALGYFVVYPLLFPGTGTPTPAPSPVATPTPLPPERRHQSFFIVPATAQTPLKLEPRTYENLIDAIGRVAEQPLPNGSLQELMLTTPLGAPLPFSAFLPLFGVFSESQLDAWFEDDFTAFLFYDDKGAWPGAIARLKPVAAPDEVRGALAELETVPLKKFFLRDPGAFGNFKTGSITGKPARYAPGTAPGAAFEYLFQNDYLLISTSYQGAKEAAARIGL